jgi:hypothetical protein
MHTNRSFEASQEESGCKQSFEVVGNSHAAQNYTPAQYHQSGKFAGRELDQEVCDDRLHDKLSYVDDGSQPGVVLP